MAEKEYIERSAVIEEIESLPVIVTGLRAGKGILAEYAKQYKNSITKILAYAPAADVAPVVHGEWIIKSEIHQMFDDVDEEMYVECPFCKRTYYVPQTYDDEEIIAYAREQYPFCNCGAKMDGGKEAAEGEN